MIDANRSAPVVGDRAPDVSLPDDGGEQRSLADYRGRAAVVLFFVRAFT